MNRENELYLLFMNQKNLVQRFLSQSIDGIKLLTGFIKNVLRRLSQNNQFDPLQNKTILKYIYF